MSGERALSVRARDVICGSGNPEVVPEGDTVQLYSGALVPGTSTNSGQKPFFQFCALGNGREHP